MPLVGRQWQFNTADQQPVRIITLSPGDHCRWCRRPVTADAVVGIPVQMLDSCGQTFVTERGTHCSFECAAAILQREATWPVGMRDTEHTQSWELLALLFRWAYPNKRLAPAPDYAITDTNIAAAIEASRSVFIPVKNLTTVALPTTYMMSPALA
jgi:hypothetical protein